MILDGRIIMYMLKLAALREEEEEGPSWRRVCELLEKEYGVQTHQLTPGSPHRPKPPQEVEFVEDLMS